MFDAKETISISEQADRLLEAPPGFFGRFFRRKKPPTEPDASKTPLARPPTKDELEAERERRWNQLRTQMGDELGVAEYDRLNAEIMRKNEAERKKRGLPPFSSGME